jgi:hypothetical protein
MHDPKIEILDKKIYITKLVKDKIKIRNDSNNGKRIKTRKISNSIVAYNEVPFMIMKKLIQKT